MKLRILTAAFAGVCMAVGVACSQPAPPAHSAPTPHPAPAAQPAPPPVPAPVREFGHFPYAEGTGLEDNVCTHGDPERRHLKPDAAAALARMKAAAAAASPKVILLPASCFRSIASQTRLFNCSGNAGTGCAKGRLASAEKRATAVAPGGHSEHATGYAIDFFPSSADIGAGGCASGAACTTSPRFANSRSGRWLAAHAHAFGFEQSFYPGSTQGVMVEAWHYRFVGTPQAEAVFHAARTQFPSPHPGAMQP